MDDQLRSLPLLGQKNRWVWRLALLGMAHAPVVLRSDGPDQADLLINQYFYTPLARVPPHWVGDAVLLSPLQKNIGQWPWWTLYLPTDFTQTGGLGSWQELEQLAQRSAQQNRLVGCDLVLQHVAANPADGGQKPVAVPPFTQKDLGELGKWGWVIDYHQPETRRKAHTIVQDYLKRGVKLFRYDAAHLIDPVHLREILAPAQLQGPLWQILELAGDRWTMMDYLARLDRLDVRAFDFPWLEQVAQAIHTDISSLASAHPLPYGQTVLPISAHDFFVRGGVWKESWHDFPLLRFFSLTAYSLPCQILTTDRSLPTNLLEMSLHSHRSEEDLQPLLEMRTRLRHQPLHWLRTGLPRHSIAYQRGDSRLFFLSRGAQEQTIVVEHCLRPGLYQELFSGRRYQIDERPLVFAQQTENRYAFERIDPCGRPAFNPAPFSIPAVVHLIWCQGIEAAAHPSVPASYQRCGLQVERWDCRRFEEQILPRLESRQQKAYRTIQGWKTDQPRHRWMILSDFMRLAILHDRGGYYADWDTLCHWPFQGHFQDYEFVVAQERGGKINNAFMGSSRGSRPLAELLEAATNRILDWQQEKAPPVCWPAGPDLFTDTIRGQMGTLVLPAHRAISYRAGVVDRSCYLSHLYASVTGDQLDPSRAHQWRASSGGGSSSSSNGASTSYRGIYEESAERDYRGYSGGYQTGADADWKPESQSGEMPAPQQDWIWIDSPFAHPGLDPQSSCPEGNGLAGS